MPALGYGARFGIEGTTPGVYAYLARITNIQPPDWSRDTVDQTHLESPNETKEFMGGLTEAGEAVISVIFDPSATDPLLAAFVAKDGNFRILFPSGTLALDFAGVVTNLAIGELVADDKMTATFTVKASGLPEYNTVP